MKRYISSWLVTKLNDFFPFVVYMVLWSLHNKKKIAFSVNIQQLNNKNYKFFNKNYKFLSLNHVDVNLKILIKSGYYIYIVPYLSTTLALLKQHILKDKLL